MMINNEVLTDIENQLNGIFSIVAPYVRILSAVRPFGNADASIALLPGKPDFLFYLKNSKCLKATFLKTSHV